jgi:hypothetical protein
MATFIRMRRRGIALALLAAAIGAATLRAQQPTQPVRPSDQKGLQGRQISLRDQLRTGLKAFTPEDFAFIDLVVLRVNQGALPRSIVDSTFLWARRRVETNRPQYRQRPMVYFQPALAARARRMGVLL